MADTQMMTTAMTVMWRKRWKRSLGSFVGPKFRWWNDYDHNDAGDDDDDGDGDKRDRDEDVGSAGGG